MDADVKELIKGFAAGEYDCSRIASFVVSEKDGKGETQSKIVELHWRDRCWFDTLLKFAPYITIVILAQILGCVVTSKQIVETPVCKIGTTDVKATATVHVGSSADNGSNKD